MCLLYHIRLFKLIYLTKVALVRTSWNDIIAHLEKWLELQKEMATPADPSISSILDNGPQVKWGKVA